MNFLPLVFIAPFCSFLLLMLTRHKLPAKYIVTLSIGAMLLAFVTNIVACYSYFNVYQLGSLLNIVVGNSLHFNGYTPNISLAFDGLTIIMVSAISFIGLLLHIFYAWYFPFVKQEDSKYSKYSSYVNLLIVAMLLVVLADNLLLFYISWEFVTLISFLLINFDSPKISNKISKYSKTSAFVFNRIANTSLAFGLFVLANIFSTDNIFQISESLQHYDPHLLIATSSIVIGVLGLSVQLPFHTWLLKNNNNKLPSLTIIASLVVTLGVYLIARLHSVFALTPNILFWWVGVIGVIGIIIGAISALAQTNLKRLLAFTSISQVGFMFLALGIGAWQSAMFHLLTFVFFQSLLLIAMETLLVSIKHKTNLLKMGQLRKQVPFVFWGFMVGSSALITLPFVTTGFYSSQGILFQAYSQGYTILYNIGLIGIVLTAMYVWRMNWLIFYQPRKNKMKTVTLTGKTYKIPLVILMILSTSVGMLFNPQFTQIFHGILPSDDIQYILMPNEYLQSVNTGGISICAIFFGMLIVWVFYTSNGGYYVTIFRNSKLGKFFAQLAHNSMGLETLYQHFFVNLYNSLEQWLNQNSDIDDEKNTNASLSVKAVALLNNGLLTIQSGSLVGYLLNLFFGLVLTFLAIQLFLLF